MRRDLRELVPEQEVAASVTATPPTPAVSPTLTGPAGPARVLALQRAGGNAAVTAMIMRQGPTAAPAAANMIDELRTLLDDGDETGAIAKMGQLSGPDAATVLGDPRMRALAVDCFDNEEMARGVRALQGGTLEQKLRWMFDEGTDWSLVRPLLADPSIPGDQKTALYPHNDLRSEFTGICDNDEMADAVRLMGGTLSQKLNWMFVEGTDWRAIRGVITDPAVPADQKLALYPLEYMKNFFVENCDNDEMAEAVILLGGTYRTERKPWLEAEGTTVNEYLNALTRLAVRETGTVAHRTPAQADQMIKDALGSLTGAAAGIATRRIQGQVAVVDDDEWDVAGLNDYGDEWPATRDTINGWVDAEERVWIHKDRGNPATMVHEGCHKWAADTIRGALSWDLNEGITEYFTRKVAAAQTPNLAPGRNNYQSQWTVVGQLVTFTSERSVASAYFDGNNDTLKNAFTSARGGADPDADWDSFLAAMRANNWANATALLAAAPAAPAADAGTGGGGTGGTGGSASEQAGPGGGGPAGATETPACR